MRNHTAVAAACASIALLLVACAADDADEHASQAGEAVRSGSQYTCSGNGCFVQDAQCLCPEGCEPTKHDPFCQVGGGWTYYVWNPCPSGGVLTCNAYGACWCQ